MLIKFRFRALLKVLYSEAFVERYLRNHYSGMVFLNLKMAFVSVKTRCLW